MGSSGKGGDSGRLERGYNAAYDSYDPNMSFGDVWETRASNLTSARMKGWNQAAADAQTAMSFESMFAAMSESMFNPEAYAASLEEQSAAAAKAAAISERDDLYSNRITAADTALNYVNAEIAQERSNAALFNVDYNITDAQKATRVNNYFATLWGEGDETKLANLMSEYGDPTGHKQFTVIRGDSSAYEQPQGGSETTVSKSSGTKAKPPTTGKTEEGLGGLFASLGG